VVFVRKILFYLVSRFILCFLSIFFYSLGEHYQVSVLFGELIFFLFMASQSLVSSAPRAAKVSRHQEYYPLWRHVTKVKAMGAGGGSWEWRCNL
jgi:hypothetical protein